MAQRLADSLNDVESRQKAYEKIIASVTELINQRAELWRTDVSARRPQQPSATQQIVGRKRRVRVSQDDGTADGRK